MRGIIYSIAIHCSAFLLAALSVAVLSTDSTPDVKSLQFVFVPEPESGKGNEGAPALKQDNPAETESDAQTAPVATAPAASEASEDVPVRDYDSHLPPTRAVENIARQEPLSSKERGPALTELSRLPNYLPVENAPSSLRSTFAFSSSRQHARVKDEYFDESFRLQPEKIAIPPKQKKLLQKKVKKLVRALKALALCDSSFVWQENGEEFEISLRPKSAPSPSDFDELIIHVARDDAGIELSTDIRMRRLAFSHFAQFVDYWDPRVVIHDDAFDGRFHTNSGFSISGHDGVHPRFKGKVTTPSYRISPMNNFYFLNPDSIFEEGIEVGADVIRFPKKFHIAGTDGPSEDSLKIVFAEETWIEFDRNGRFSWRGHSPDAYKVNKKLPNKEPFVIIGKKNATLHVKGTVAGTVLVYSEKKIVIDGSLMCAHDPRLFPASEDYLGLVCEKNIEIAHPKVTGPGDLHIQAAILAKKQFVVKNLYGHGKATLCVYGSLSAGSLTATEPRYATRIKFDKRLEIKRPPNFPMTSRFELIDWDGLWKVDIKN